MLVCSCMLFMTTTLVVSIQHIFLHGRHCSLDDYNLSHFSPSSSQQDDAPDSQESAQSPSEGASSPATGIPSPSEGASSPALGLSSPSERDSSASSPSPSSRREGGNSVHGTSPTTTPRTRRGRKIVKPQRYKHITYITA